MFLCPVRDCRLPLSREDERLFCSKGHSFDIARSGYINLLQPQDRRSKAPGDAAEVLAARTQLHDRGLTRPFRDAIMELAASSPDDVILDVGCGDGYYLAALTRNSGVGIDISLPSVQAAARRYRNNQWVVANADRFIPCAARTFSLMLSITGRMNAPEFRRVIREDGQLLVAVPGPDDLIEVREEERDRKERTVEFFANRFRLENHERVTVKHELNASAVSDVLVSIYRPRYSKPIEAMSLTFSLDLLLFRPI